MSDYIVPLIFLLVLALATFKKVDAYSFFARGVKAAFELCISTFPYIAAIMIMVQLLKIGGVTNFLCGVLSPVFGFLGIPPELTELILLKPFTGSGSLALLNETYAAYGADSHIGRCASVIAGASDTIFYLTAVYFSTSTVKKLRFAIPVALFAAFVGIVVGCNLV